MVRAQTASREGWHTQVSNGVCEVSVDTTPDKGGASLGMRPHELLAAALASCMQMTLRMLAAERGWPLEEARCEVRLKREPTVVTFVYHVELDGPLTQAQRRALREAAKRCPVRRTLSSELRFEETEPAET